jgi:hypothetical protein
VESSTAASSDWSHWIACEQKGIKSLVHTLPIIRSIEDGSLTIDCRLERLNEALMTEQASWIDFNETGRFGASPLMMILNFYYKAIPVVPYDKIDKQAEILLRMMDRYKIVRPSTHLPRTRPS